MILLKKAARLGALHAMHSGRNLLPRRRDLIANSALRDAHRGQRCFILGSGKSILEQDLTRLRGELVITQNSFHMHPEISVIAPRYHCVVPMFQGSDFDRDWVQWFREMEERLPATTRLVAGVNSKSLLERNGLFRGRVSYIHSGLDPFFLTRARVDLTRTIIDIPTALTQCLAVALYLGFAKIVLLGFDLTQMCEGHTKNFGRFYGSSPVTRNEAERGFELERDWSGENWFEYWRMWQTFVLLRGEAKRRGGEIVNATRGGLLDCFRRETYEDLLA